MMVCPKCRKGKLRASNTRTMGDNTMVRDRRCSENDCRAVFETLETIVSKDVLPAEKLDPANTRFMESFNKLTHKIDKK